MELMFTELAKKAIELSRDIALRLGHEYIGTEHLLVGLRAVDKGFAADLLRSCGISTDDLEHRVKDLDSDERRNEYDLRRGLRQQHPIEGSATSGLIPLSSECKHVLQESGVEASHAGVEGICTEHLLLAIMRYHENAAVELLTPLDITYNSLRSQLGSA